MKQDIHLIYNSEAKRWEVIREGEQIVLEHAKTKAEADKLGRKIAKAEKVEFVIHNRNGKISDSDSFGKEGKGKDSVH